MMSSNKPAAIRSGHSFLPAAKLWVGFVFHFTFAHWTNPIQHRFHTRMSQFNYIIKTNMRKGVNSQTNLRRVTMPPVGEAQT